MSTPCVAKYTPHTLNAETLLKLFLKEELITKNPFDKFEGLKKDAHQIDILTRDELNNLLKVAKSHSNKPYKHFRDTPFAH